MRQFTDYCSIIFCVTTASTEEDRRYSLAVSSGSLPFPYPPLGDQPGHLVLPGDVDHCQSCNFFSNSSITFLEEYLLQGWTNRERQCELPLLDCESTTLPSQSNCVISRFCHETLKGWVYSITNSPGRYCCLCNQWGWDMPHHGGSPDRLRKVIANACHWSPHASWYLC